MDHFTDKLKYVMTWSITSSFTQRLLRMTSHIKSDLDSQQKKTANHPDVAAKRAREQPPSSITRRLMNSRLVLLMQEPFGPQEPCVLTTFCLDTHKQWGTSGVLGAQTLRKGRWCPGSRTAPPLTWEKRGAEAGEQVPSLLFSSSIEIREGVTVALIWHPIRSTLSAQRQRISSMRIPFEKCYLQLHKKCTVFLIHI